jgi:hypothetical protein
MTFTMVRMSARGVKYCPAPAPPSATPLSSRRSSASPCFAVLVLGVPDQG